MHVKYESNCEYLDEKHQSFASFDLVHMYTIYSVPSRTLETKLPSRSLHTTCVIKAVSPFSNHPESAIANAGNSYIFNFYHGYFIQMRVCTLLTRCAHVITFA